MYSLFTVSELKIELRKRNASAVGKKADLIKRLDAYDRNQNFDDGLGDLEDNNSLICPSADTYRDMNADSPVPKISKQEIREYFLRLNTEPKGQLLYESRYLLTARYSSAGAYTFLRGMVKASMKKAMYLVDIKVSQEGAIEECHCECPARSGTSANCKHVCVLLLGAHDIVNNQTILLHEPCTQQLMTFKKPIRVFQKSPIAAQNLPSKRKCTVNYNPLAEIDIMDNYVDYVRNLAFGYGATTMPLLQSYPPANLHGTEWDHSYASRLKG